MDSIYKLPTTSQELV